MDVSSFGNYEQERKIAELNGGKLLGNLIKTKIMLEQILEQAREIEIIKGRKIIKYTNNYYKF